MSTSIDQKAYLQKYLGGSSGDKKKKKKKAVKGKGFKIIDDDIDLSKLRPLDGDEIDILDQGEDGPVIAGIIDERPEELKKMEQFKTSSKWRVVNQDDGFNSKLQIEEIKRDVKETEKENEFIFGKMYSDSEDEKKNDSDLSPPRKSNDNRKSVKASGKHDGDSDFSPPRKSNKSPKRHNSKYESDKSPRPDKPKERVRKSRWGERSPEQSSSKRHSSQSPSRKSKKDSARRSESSDASPPRKSQKNQDSDASPPRKSKKNHDSDASPPKKSKKNHDSDSSPPRKLKHSSTTSPRKSRKNYDSDASPPRKSKKRHESESPPRKSKIDSKNRKKTPEPRSNKRKSPQRYQNDRHTNNKHDRSMQHRQSPDSDVSPPRKQNRQISSSPHKKSKNNKRKYNSDSDQSPPRRDKDKNTSDKDRNTYKKSDDCPPPSNKRMERTLEGKMAGLQNARQLRDENEHFRRKEDDVYNKMSDEVSGRNAQVVSRKSKRETSEDRQKQKEKAERQKELDEKYKKWSKGLKQVQDQETRVQEFMHEASKPLARHKDDRDLEQNLRQVERAGDPMLQYIREKKRERGELGPEKPSYKGSFPPNRFNIRPGYRWDGVDRSNGYERKFFEQQSKKKAHEEEAYKWSTEDL